MYEDFEFDDPKLRIGSEEWWAEVEKYPSLHHRCTAAVGHGVRVGVVSKRIGYNDILKGPIFGWVVEFGDLAGTMALCFKNPEDAIKAADEWNAQFPRRSWRSIFYSEE